MTNALKTAMESIKKESARIKWFTYTQSMQNDSPQPVILAIKAINLHTFGVQVGFRVYQGLGSRVHVAI